MNCMLYVDESNLLIGCQTGRLVTTDLSTMQVTSEVSGPCQSSTGPLFQLSPDSAPWMLECVC